MRNSFVGGACPTFDTQIPSVIEYCAGTLRLQIADRIICVQLRLHPIGRMHAARMEEIWEVGLSRFWKILLPGK